MTESRRATWRRRFALSLLAAAATFVIVFEFLALQLQSTGSPVSGVGAGGAKAASVRAAGGTAITSRTSGSPASPTVSSTAPAVSRPVAAHSRHSHSLTTRVSGAAMRNGGEADDL